MKSLKRSQTSTSSNSSSPSSSSSSSSSTSWVHLRSVLFVVASSSPASCSSSDRGHLKSPWSRRKRKRILSPQQWRSFFTQDGRLRAGGVKFLKKVRSGGVDPSIRAEVWPFLLGVYDLNSSKEERDAVRNQKRKEYEKLRRHCRRLLKCTDEAYKLRGTSGTGDGNSEILTEGMESPDSEDAVSARESLSSGERSPYNEYSDNPADVLFDRVAISRRITEPNYVSDYESSDSDSSSDPEASLTLPSMESMEENTTEMPSREDSSPSTEVQSQLRNSEDFATWQRIIRLDAIRSNGEWMTYSATQGAPVTDDRARRCAEAVGLKDYDHLDPSRIFHAARLVAILEAYALYDPEIGYCQGMSDLLSPIISVITEDFEAFWCFVGFMKKARHNFRLDEVGIRRQLNIVSKIIKYKDSHLYRHLEKLQAEDCFFVYRMVIVLFRRELTFDQTLCLWEVMWADQAAIRAGIGKSAWSRIRLRAPPTEDLLLYAIAASVLQRRKQIIEKYSSMDEILRECNNMAGHLDVWKLLDDAHDLVVTLHDKI
nr:GTPase-activating protein gyp7-like isoform X2 [Ipomoea trifida]GMC96450.1 GTPase-activating protein gyp7-like isoform X2 [Ipomoea batatas]GMC98628.1 GTPase-activating protein gyp7-like isoform X2 [Ipomoea batatas]GMD20509.1 GTPase-activating protein gyp7-like isoform X2 [Ipomoea batatas]GME19359.1 GTPase-activating protein gyp7-like isoform X2 [Ipomoea batatas]